MMDDEQSYALGDMDRRMGNLVRMGTIAAVDPAKGLAKVDLGDLTTDWLPWTTTRAGNDRAWSTPDVGEQVVVVSPGEPSQGVIMGSMFQDSKPQNGATGDERRLTFGDGTVVEFNRATSQLNITVNPAGGIKLVVGASTLEITNAGVKVTAPRIDWNS